MKRMLVVVDAQVDFTTGRLGSENAAKVARKLSDFVKKMHDLHWFGFVLATMDTHFATDFRNKESIEAQAVPPHCIAGSPGHALVDSVAEHVDAILYKSTFMSSGDEIRDEIANFEGDACDDTAPEEICICGFCTDICVISQALLLRRQFPKAEIFVIEDLCAGTNEANHRAAIDVMKSCLVRAVNSREIEDRAEKTDACA